MSIFRRLRYEVKDRLGAWQINKPAPTVNTVSTPALTSTESYRGDWDAERTLGGRTPAEFWETLSSRPMEDWNYRELGAYYDCLKRQLYAQHVDSPAMWAVLDPIEDVLTLRRQAERAELDARSTADLEAERDELAGVRVSSLTRKQLAELFTGDLAYTQEEISHRLAEQEINIDKVFRRRRIENYLQFTRYNAEREAAKQAREAAKSPAERRADALYEELMHAQTLENTPAAFMNGELDYDTEAGDAPMVEDAGSDHLEATLDAHLRAHPELASVKKFAPWYRDDNSMGLS